MTTENNALDTRLRRVDAVRNHSRKVVYTLFAVAITSLVVAVAKF